MWEFTTAAAIQIRNFVRQHCTSPIRLHRATTQSDASLFSGSALDDVYLYYNDGLTQISDFINLSIVILNR